MQVLITIDDQRLLHPRVWDLINQLSRQPPEVKLIYKRIHDEVNWLNDCVHMGDYHHGFSARAQLGNPIKSYVDDFQPLTPEDILIYLRRYEYSNQNAYVPYLDSPVLNAINALQLLGSQKDIYDYLRAERFMQCDQSRLRLAMMNAMIKKIPEYFDGLYGRFQPLLYCSDTATRSQIFRALSAIADRQTLNDMIEQVLQDDSAVVKRSAAYSTYAAAITYAEREAMMSRMLSSDNADERMFAAMMMKRSVYWSHPDKMRTLCQAEPAAWHYDDASESDSIAQICQDLLQTLSESSRESSETQALLDEFYSG